MKRMQWLTLTACVAFSTLAARADDPQYMAIFMRGVKIGHVVTQRIVAANEVTNRQDFHLTLHRAGVSIQISTSGEFVETPEGRPLRFRHATQMGPLGGSTKAGLIRGSKIHLTGAAAGRTVPYPTGALLPEGVRLLQQAKGLKAGTKYSFTSFDPDNFRAIRTDAVIGEPASVPLIGQVATLTRVDTVETIGGQSIKGITYVDSDLNARKISMSMMGMELKLVGCEKSYALSPGGQIDLVKAGSVESPAAIANPRGVCGATFTLKPLRPDLKLDLPETSWQGVSKGPDGEVTVTVTAFIKVHGKRPYAGDDPDAIKALEANEYVQSRHPAIVRQARKIVGATSSSLEAGRAIEEWVRNYITEKNLSVGFASAAETLTSKAGDCSEHAVLTAALCRAAGIPCRVVCGLAYVDAFNGLSQRFIGHAWNEIYVGGHWVQLDASLGVDAARFALSVGSGEATGFIGMANSLGNFKVARAEAR